MPSGVSSYGSCAGLQTTAVSIFLRGAFLLGACRQSRLDPSQPIGFWMTSRGWLGVSLKGDAPREFPGKLASTLLIALTCEVGDSPSEPRSRDPWSRGGHSPWSLSGTIAMDADEMVGKRGVGHRDLDPGHVAGDAAPVGLDGTRRRGHAAGKGVGGGSWRRSVGPRVLGGGVAIEAAGLVPTGRGLDVVMRVVAGDAVERVARSPYSNDSR